MLTVKEALDLVINESQPLNVVKTSLTSVFQKVLRHEVLSMEDSPPFAKSMMDGFGIRIEDFKAGLRAFRCVQVITAGMKSELEIRSGETVQIMTGAPIPAEINAVIPIELTEHEPGVSPLGLKVMVKTEDVRKGQHILKQGENYGRGNVIVPAGRRIRAQELAALCEAGIGELEVSRELSVAVLATGNELVNADQVPGAAKIRNSNEPMLLAQIEQNQAKGIPLGVARDELEQIREKVQRGLKEDILLLTGGVSAGTLDLVPQVLTEEGVKEVFHKVSLKPGKPIWFGIKEVEGHKTYVYGLPGNPVSSMICFELFVKPLIKKLIGLAEYESISLKAIVKQNYRFRSDRPTYHPVKCYWEQGILHAEILKWTGSSDLTSTVLANGTGIFEPGEREYLAGETITVLLWD